MNHELRSHTEPIGATTNCREARIGGLTGQWSVNQNHLPTWKRSLHPKVSSAVMQIIELCAADIRAAMRAADYGDDVIAKFLLPVEIVLEEAFVNAVRHGNACDPQLVAVIRWLATDTCIVIDVIDEGSGFDLDAVPDCTAPENLGSEHGRGIHLMRTFMDDVVYHGCGNHLTLRKNFP